MRLPWTGKSSWRPALASTWQVHSCEPARSVREIWQSYTLGRLLSEGAERIIMGFSEHIDIILNWTEIYLRRPSAASLICCSRSTRYCSFCRRLALSDTWAPGTVMHLFLNTLLSSRTVQSATALHNKSANESVSKQQESHWMQGWMVGQINMDGWMAGWTVDGLARVKEYIRYKSHATLLSCIDWFTMIEEVSLQISSQIYLFIFLE